MLIGIGAQKSATSWAFAALGAHPGVVLPIEKELDFFTHRFERGVGWYSRQWPSGHGLRVEISPSYLPDARAARRAAKILPNAKIFVLLRDPIERAYSAHLHEIRKGHIPAESFEQGALRNPTYLHGSRYGRHLRPWVEFFGRDRVLVMFAEEISEDPQGAAQRLYAFAGLPRWVSPITDETRNVSDMPRHAGLRRTLRAAGDWMRRMGLEQELAQIKRLSPVAKLLAANSQPLRDQVPPMSQTTRLALKAELANDVQELAQFLGRSDLPWKGWDLTQEVRLDA